MKIVSILLIVIGCVLFGIGVSMETKQNAFTRLETTIKEGDKDACTTAGAIVGGTVGVGAGATIGGIGVTLCGTGVGIPVGIVCLGCGVICALIGGGVGSAVGTEDKVINTPITDVVNAYSPMEYWTVMILGACIVAAGIFLLYRLLMKEKK